MHGRHYDKPDRVQKVDADSAIRKFQKELNAGAGALVVLGLLRRANKPMYGYEIGKHLEELSEQHLPMHQGALYPALRSLEKGGLLASKVEPSVSGPPRRYYQITPLGRQVLVEWLNAWRRTKDFVDSVVEQSHGEDDPPPTPGDRAVPARTQAVRAKGAKRDARRGNR